MRSLHPLCHNLASQILRHLFSFRGIIACIAIVLPDFLMLMRRDRPLASIGNSLFLRCASVAN
ncbi:hypothetical protein [Nostoc sp.]|uniref:hypothetical protein n=1 Tax=Nostoc sp. TaxID=1180 RepID=UPI002FF703F0